MTSPQKVKSLLKEWDAVKAKIEAIKQNLNPLVDQERTLRKQIIDAFADKQEGSRNEMALANGYTLKLNYKLKREIDEPALASLYKELEEAKVPVEMLIKHRPQLELKVYRALSEDQQKVVDKALLTKEDSHTITIVPPKV